MKRGYLKRQKPLKSLRMRLIRNRPLRGIKRAMGRSKANKRASKGLMKWLKAIPEGSHGSGTLQKRLWRLKSDFVRIRDFHAFGPKCVATGRPINHWREGQAGHFKSYTKCNGMFKFHEMNIHLQCAMSNSWGDKDDWKGYEQELVKRYGQEFVDAIETSNKDWPVKITTELVITEIERTLKMIEMLPEQPDYFERVMHLKDLQSKE